MACGAEVGCGFYRAGRLLHWFTFRNGAAGIRPLAMPTIAGRLIEVAATFEGTRILIHVECEQNGQRRRELFVVEATGKLLGRFDSQHQQCNVGGACMAGRHVLMPTDAGVLRLSLEAQGLGSPTLFQDTAPYVSASDRLLTGLKRTLYVVSDVTITQLSILSPGGS